MNPHHETDCNGSALSYASDPAVLKPRPTDGFYRATTSRMNPNLPGFEADKDQFPPVVEFENIVQDYLQNLSTKKRDKALVDRQRYQLILQVLKDPRNTAISTAQFRFWVKKMFQLQRSNTKDIVCHDDKPVAMREHIYSILVQAHRDAHHGGRDKTSALVILFEISKDTTYSTGWLLGSQAILVDPQRADCAVCPALSILHNKKEWLSKSDHGHQCTAARVTRPPDGQLQASRL